MARLRHAGALWRRRLFGWALVVLIFLVAPRPGEGLPWMVDRLGSLLALLDEVGHLFLFGILAFLAHRAAVERDLRAPLLVAFLGAVVYGALTEAIQMTVPTRSAEWSDLAADVCGGLLYTAAALGRRIPIG